ncbi:sigma-70 family RNA polymerase sigma factor [Herbaspirillum sp. RTI4]|uniref:sigma-70 family RNA polymerase sigma factor n=1 Tax=Herbaspirillum sp. RTI4 TaxID=3048640 RepID=UPI002AB4BEBE|nr:sigma-70 family RNA polymerase sigma factor [Herbaspirillum sp. RTI4]MDY7580013.1 sigma-70 family RNA polymerase sigma factor [Herbaspirillum sp. RTI4]MEA9982827.1 sigma-70 family RNA polymerase sigma factor [Herbaspirillum sp. RTI4]
MMNGTLGWNTVFSLHRDIPRRTVISHPDPSQLETFLAECALGNQRSFEALYRAVSPQLYAIALKSLRRKDWAEEVLQESFLRIWHHAGRFDMHLSAPMTWMINITRNLAIDQLRKRQEETLPDNDQNPIEQHPDEAAGPYEQLAASQDKAALSRCLATLEGSEREALITAYFQGISYAELAGQMRAPLGSVKSWIRRGMDRLRKCLES